MSLEKMMQKMFLNIEKYYTDINKEEKALFIKFDSENDLNKFCDVLNILGDLNIISFYQSGHENISNVFKKSTIGEKYRKMYIKTKEYNFSYGLLVRTRQLWKAKD